MKRKLVNKIILTLTIILAITSIYTFNKYSNLKERQNTKTIIYTKDENNLISKEIIVKKLNDENKMLVLSGDVEVQMTYSNKDITEDDVGFVWLKEWLNKESSKDLNIKATYTYNFHYDLKDLDIDIIDNKVNINLSKNRLSSDVSLVENKTIYTDRVGVFETQFTPQEINSLNKRNKDLVLNKIQNDNTLRDRAIENIQDNIEDLLGIKCVFNIAQYDVVENDNKILKEVDYGRE